MPRGDKSAYTDKQKRQAAAIEASVLEQGRSQATAERIAWATVNKQDGGGKLSGSGRKPARAGATRKAAKKTTKQPAAKAAKKTAKQATTQAARKTVRKASATGDARRGNGSTPRKPAATSTRGKP